MHSCREGIDRQHDKKIDRCCDEEKLGHGVNKIPDKELATIDGGSLILTCLAIATIDTFSRRWTPPGLRVQR
jgi:hypothetical protein